jgi:DNA-binding MarR family transcriptional regulator
MMESLTLTWLVDQQIQKLTGAQFKLAAYLYRHLQRKPELTIRAKDLATATGLSLKSADSASRHLEKQNILAVTGGPGATKTYRLPAAKPVKPGPAQPGGSKTNG